ncbi:hypothetical protein J7E50_24610 [Pedobacter sp. ISL-68]|uniref:hypothetical protein n=1 Tax=unclassified Pedobacter TaxID=2628915 RepID=UPI001BEA7935|nr:MULTISPECIES: hypothetical protein [unclassified Pedobacter]MBT2564869.1 hypothetical protein [Pedobacter sp. ISL-64]MBT2593426.1 hypothetical protein [Pedobacter sp. ISL-68]
MNFYDRYKNGESHSVYADIEKLGEEAFSPSYYPDVEKVLIETFQRVRFNLEIIYKELKNIDYVFWADETGNDEALLMPFSNTDELLNILEQNIELVGKLPVSMKMFYQIVGSCNFAWNYQDNPDILWEMADPIQVAPLTDCVSQVTDQYWLEEMEEYIQDDDFGFAFLDLSADDLHKDNVSGGPPYALQLNKEKSIDSKFLNEPNDTTFINYLRICFESCGFPGMPYADNKEFQKFFDKVKPQLQKI